MSEPRGYNPIGQSAPGLPRHDAPLPGHVPGQYTPLAGQDDAAPMGTAGYRDPGFSPAFGIWSGRAIMVGIMYVTLPIQVALYPVAGAAGVLAGGVAYLLLGGMGRDDRLNWGWFICFAALLPATRVEIRLENRFPAYRRLRHWLRVVLIGGWMYYFQVYDQQETPLPSVVVALIVAAVAHFVLRAQLITGFWHQLQAWLWLREA